MSKVTQQLFKRIVLHNKLLAEDALDSLLAEAPDPQQALRTMLQRQVLNEKTAQHLWAIYQKQLDKLFADQIPAAEASAAAASKPPPADTAPAVDSAAAESKPAAAAEPADDWEAELAAAWDSEPTATSKPAAPAGSAASSRSSDAAESPPEPPAAPVRSAGFSRSPGAGETPPESPDAAVRSAASSRSSDAEARAAEGIRPLPPAGLDLLRCLLQDARLAGASDLHVKTGMAPVVRVNGSLQNLPRPALSPNECERSLKSILTEEQSAQFDEQLDLDFSYDGGPGLGRFRTNYLRQHRGIDGVFRLIPEKVPSFEELHLPDAVKRFTEQRVGIVLVTGPKGCGKTTTLAAMIDRINSQRAEHIITVEDPIEFVHPCKKGHVNQRQVGVHTQSFSNALRSALREAPDVIMVGEMRDLETTSLAITAAETGHLVLATLHTPDAIRTIGRILDVFPPKEQPQIRAMVSESLRGICSQLLLPSADGRAMVLAVEVLVNTQAIGHLIREEKVHQIRGLMQTGKQYGMVLMDESLIRLAKEGRISKQAAVSRAENVRYVRAELAVSD